jgi:phosphoribosylformimino-5-aminoimidazole carboxamide ribotide isomerase
VGVTHINFSDISRDGMMMGLDTEKILLFLRMARSVAVSGLYFTYAGGVSSLNDVKGLKRLGSDGVDAVVVGKALYEDKFSLKEAIVLAS